MNFLFLPDKLKIKKKQEKRICNSNDKEKFAIHIKNLKQGLNHNLIFKKFYRVIRFNQKVWLKQYIFKNIFFN